MFYIVNFTTPQGTRHTLIVYESEIPEKTIHILFYNRNIRPNRYGQFPNLAGSHLHFVEIQKYRGDIGEVKCGFNLGRRSIEVFCEASNEIQDLNKLNELQITAIWEIIEGISGDLPDPATFVLVNTTGTNHRTTKVLNAVSLLQVEIYDI